MSQHQVHNQHIKYECTRCGAACGRAALTAKRVQFKEIGNEGKLLMTRTVDWLCPECCSKDPDFHRPVRAASPGMQGTRIAV